MYFVGSKELEVALPSTEINVIKLDSAIRLGAFGGVNNSNDWVYLGIGANGTVGGRVQIPENIRAIGGLGVDVANINLIVGGQTTFPIRNVSVEEGMKQAFENVDVYIGAMAYVGNWLANARVWVLVPQIVETDFRKGGGWDIEVKVFGYLPEWNWEDKGVTPIVQGMLLEDCGEDVLDIYTEEAAEPSAAVPESTMEGNGEPQRPLLVHLSRPLPVHLSRPLPEHLSRPLPEHPSRHLPKHLSRLLPKHLSRLLPLHLSWKAQGRKLPHRKLPHRKPSVG